MSFENAKGVDFDRLRRIGIIKLKMDGLAELGKQKGFGINYMSHDLNCALRTQPII